ncbi:MAG TPA: undecaprenyl-phosphate glucose phosphotransferase [Chloroflexi bacterium]|nr:undecaprenyl-phosphate glucose phosphotransferase [Chloroflexota bacterium]
MKAARAQRLFTLFLLLTDVAVAALAFVWAYLLRLLIPFPDPAQTMPGPLDYLPMLFIYIVAMLVTFFFARLYNLSRISRVDEFYSILVAGTIGSLVSIALASLLLRDFTVGPDYSRAMIFYAWALFIGLATLGRVINSWVRRKLVRYGWGRRRALLVGTGEIARMILQKILWSPELGYDVVGIVAAHDEEGRSLSGIPVRGDVTQLAALITEHAADEVIIALPEETPHSDILWLISECERGRVIIRVYPDLFQIIAGPVSIAALGGIPMLTVQDIALTGWWRVAKRAVDIVGAAVMLVLLAPLMWLIALLIKLESPGPVFYLQERMGLDARPFYILKFRSMRQDAERQGPGWTTADDPRRTHVGTFLRKTNLDEFPQFINVLLGDMSMVGPRPERPVYVEQFRRSIPRYMDRHREKAGMTGWAQVNGLRGDTSIVERTKYDLWYIENWSLLLDFKIIIRTILQFFRSPNAY